MIYPTPVKLFGLQRTGTNLMHHLLVANFRISSLEEGGEWKHGPCESVHQITDKQYHKWVVCTKNPYAWCLSMFNYFHREWDPEKGEFMDGTVDKQFNLADTFSDFLRKPHYEFENPIDRWNRMNLHWLGLPADRMIVVRHERMLGEPKNQKVMLLEVEKHLSLIRLSRVLSVARQRIDVNRSKRGEMNHSYYLNHEYMTKYSADDISLVQSQLNDEALLALGYAR